MPPTAIIAAAGRQISNGVTLLATLPWIGVVRIRLAGPHHPQTVGNAFQSWTYSRLALIGLMFRNPAVHRILMQQVVHKYGRTFSPLPSILLVPQLGKCLLG